MSDDIDTGPIVTGEVAPAPSDRRPEVIADERSRDQLVREQFNMGLGLTAHGTEDATDYIKERETQAKFLDGDGLSPEQYREWHERTHTALQRALDQQARARGEVPPSPQDIEEKSIPGVYVSPTDPNYEAIIEANKERFSDYFDNPENIGNQNTAAEHKKAVADWISTYDPKSVLVGHFMASPLGPQMMEALEGEPQAIQYLANLPPQVRAGEMKKLEGYLAAKEELRQQNAIYQEPQAPEPRRFTQAPPPISPPRGGANPPKDLFSLATKSDVKDYVETRRKQEYQAWKDQQFDGGRR